MVAEIRYSPLYPKQVASCRYILINSAVMPTPGLTYSPVVINKPNFCRLVIRAAKQGILISHIGYPQTAEFISRLTGAVIPVNRDPAVAQRGDVLLICKLTYRVGDPVTKGRPVDAADFVFWACEVG